MKITFIKRLSDETMNYRLNADTHRSTTDNRHGIRLRPRKFIDPFLRTCFFFFFSSIIIRIVCGIVELPNPLNHSTNRFLSPKNRFASYCRFVSIGYSSNESPRCAFHSSDTAFPRALSAHSVDTFCPQGIRRFHPSDRQRALRG